MFSPVCSPPPRCVHPRPTLRDLPAPTCTHPPRSVGSRGRVPRRREVFTSPVRCRPGGRRCGISSSGCLGRPAQTFPLPLVVLVGTHPVPRTSSLRPSCRVGPSVYREWGPTTGVGGASSPPRMRRCMVHGVGEFEATPRPLRLPRLRTGGPEGPVTPRLSCGPTPRETKGGVLQQSFGES